MYIQDTNFMTKMAANMCTRLTHGVKMAGSCCVTDFNEKYQTFPLSRSYYYKARVHDAIIILQAGVEHLKNLGRLNKRRLFILNLLQTLFGFWPCIWKPLPKPQPHNTGLTLVMSMKAVLFFGAPWGGEEDLLACGPSSCSTQNREKWVHEPVTQITCVQSAKRRDAVPNGCFVYSLSTDSKASNVAGA